MTPSFSESGFKNFKHELRKKHSDYNLLGSYTQYRNWFEKKLAFRGTEIIQLLPSLTEKHDVPPHESSLQGNGHKTYHETH